jgi:hypothetical protein
MKYRCTGCGDIIESTYQDKFVMCICESVFVDGGYDHTGNQLLHRAGYLKDGADLIPVEEH